MPEIPVPPHRNPAALNKGEDIDDLETATASAPRRSSAAARKAAGDESQSDGIKIVLRMKRGMYVGLGCPDKDDRLRAEDVSFGYSHDHPARVKFKDVPVFADNGDGAQRYVRTDEVYENGELVQLWPIPEHEKAQAEDMRSKDKRHTFSQKEAQKRAQSMIKDGVAEWA